MTTDAWVDDPLPACIERHVVPVTRPGVYALELATPDRIKTARERYHDNFDAPEPEWVRKAWEANRTIYVGGAAHVNERVRSHLDGDGKSSQIMKVYPPMRVVDVWPCDDATEAFERESKLALEYQAKNPMQYVHQR